jgi:hypothetical protein
LSGEVYLPLFRMPTGFTLREPPSATQTRMRFCGQVEDSELRLCGLCAGAYRAPKEPNRGSSENENRYRVWPVTCDANNGSSWMIVVNTEYCCVP